MTNFAQSLFINNTLKVLDLNEPVQLDRSEPVIAAVKTFRELNIGSVLVVDEMGLIEGIFTERDVLKSLVNKDVDLLTTAIIDLSTKDLVVVKQSSSIARAVYNMAVDQVRHLPVVQTKNNPLGMISAKDIVDYAYRLSIKDSKKMPTEQRSVVKAFLQSTIEVLRPSKPVCIDSKASCKEALDLMLSNAIGSVLVVDSTSKIQGIFTERDFIRKALVTEPKLDEIPIHSVMTENPVSLQDKEFVSKAFQLMSEGRFRHLPIVDSDQRPIGMLSVRDFLKYLAEGLVVDLDTA